MEGVKKIFNKENGSYFAFLALIISILTHLIGALLYYSGDQSFSITSHAISEMGATTAPNGSYFVFTIGFFLYGVITIFFYIYLTQNLLEKGTNKLLSWVSCVMGLMSAIALILVTIFPMDIAWDMHFYTALLYFFGLLLMGIFYGITELTSTEIKKFQALLSISLAIIIIIAIGLGVIFFTTGELYEGSVLLEWVISFINWIWMFSKGILIKTKKNKK